MKAIPTAIPDMLLIEPKVFGDERGFFYESWNERTLKTLGIVIASEVFDVALDLRKSSPTFGKSVSFTLSAENKHMVWIPPGFARGFCVTSNSAEFLYKTTDYWSPEFERSLLWNDPALKIDWPLMAEPTLAAKDAQGTPFAKVEAYA